MEWRETVWETFLNPMDRILWFRVDTCSGINGMGWFYLWRPRANPASTLWAVAGRLDAFPESMWAGAFIPQMLREAE